MAHLWKQFAGEWQAISLSGSGHDLGADVTLRPAAGGTRWVLLAGRARDGHPAVRPTVRVNGEAVSLGIRVLRDRDMLQLGGGGDDDAGAVFFSTERMAAVAPYHPAGTNARPIKCRRCQQVISEGEPVVTCPGCATVYHQSEDCPCWTYAQTCAECPHATDLEAGFAWVPEEV